MSNKKKQKRRMSEATKENLTTIFKSIYSNDAAMQGARHNPWWVAVIFFLISIILPIIPIFVSSAKTYGSSFIASKSYDLETPAAVTFADMYQNNVDLVVSEQGYLIEGTEGTWQSFAGDDGEYAYINSNSHQIDLITYYTTKTGKDLKTETTALSKRQYVVGTADIYSPSENEDSSSETSSEAIQTYTPSFIILSKEYIAIQLFKPNTSTSVATFTGDYLNLKGFSIKELAITDNFDGNAVTAMDLEKISSEYTAEVFKGFKKFINKSYLETKNKAMLYTNLLAFGIYVVLALFLGLLIFLITRGKKSVFRVLNIGTCLKIEAWTMFTPALISMILGFIMPNFMLMYFIILLGLRTMWLTMKQLRPIGQ